MRVPWFPSSFVKARNLFRPVMMRGEFAIIPVFRRSFVRPPRQLGDFAPAIVKIRQGFAGLTICGGSTGVIAVEGKEERKKPDECKDGNILDGRVDGC